jgi:hypothetical protein
MPHLLNPQSVMHAAKQQASAVRPPGSFSPVPVDTNNAFFQMLRHCVFEHPGLYAEASASSATDVADLKVKLQHLLRAGSAVQRKE